MTESKSTSNARRPGKVGGKRDLNRKKRVADLCDAALGLFLARGIANVTIDDIVKQAGVAKGSFYRYFDNKEALVASLLEPAQEAFRTTFRAAGASLTKTDDDGAVSEWLVVAANLATSVFQHPRLIRLYLQESRGPAVGARRPIRELADELLEGAVGLSKIARARGMTRDEDPRVSALAVIGASEQLLFAYLSGVDLGSPADVPRKLIAIIMDGVRARD